MRRGEPRDRNPGNDPVVPAEDGGREAQDRAKTNDGKGGARSPVDAMHTDAPTKQKNARGHSQVDGSQETE